MDVQGNKKLRYEDFQERRSSNVSGFLFIQNMQVAKYIIDFCFSGSLRGIL